MYGGGFATVPAYLADMFGTQFVGAIHGRLLTAWSTAGIIGPVVVNYIRECADRRRRAAATSVYDSHHVHPGRHAGARASSPTCWSGRCAERWFMSEEEVVALTGARRRRSHAATGSIGIGQWRLDAGGGAGVAGGRHSDRLGRLGHADQRRRAVPLTTARSALFLGAFVRDCRAPVPELSHGAAGALLLLLRRVPSRPSRRGRLDRRRSRV